MSTHDQDNTIAEELKAHHRVMIVSPYRQDPAECLMRARSRT